ncbi:hypothetical protein Pcinc_006952 [Petrolisthes cinctipes]|uniref:Uncharacterized protein n=1 Tax=Petrolisthes cinctipes TaxID=88211 RepID=A0AAE1GAH9_PETCI|nr:hypothetical protein Pcinc_006952 [Petrolisthes cinctipes]
MIKRKKKGKRRPMSKIKWWKMKDEKLKDQFKEKVLAEIELKDDVEEWWNANAGTFLQTGEEIFGRTSGRDPPNDKETWWWNEEVVESIKLKKSAKKENYVNTTPENKERLKLASKAEASEEEAYEELYFVHYL